MTDKNKKTRAYFAYFLSVLRLRRFALLSIAVTSLVVGMAVSNQPVAAATPDNLNFQARLQSASGNIVPDGYYNIQFKLYDALSGGTNLWTESYYDSNGATAGNDNRVRVVNGYVTVNLGSQTAFPGSIPWDQQLYLTMNVGGTTQTATPTYDGEMSPRLKLTAVPYAFNAKSASQLVTTNGAFTSTLQLQPTASNQVFQIPDQGAAGTYTLLTQQGAAGVLAGSFIQNQNTAAQTSANFWIDGNARAQGQTILGGSTNQTQLIVRANASQTAANPLIMLQNSAGTELTRINVDANNNYAFGQYALQSSTGSQNVAIGHNNLVANGSGSGNVAVGANVLDANTIGTNNVGIGLASLGANIAGTSNIAIGVNSLGNSTISVGNVALGSAALSNISTGTAGQGDYNVAIGDQAGRGVTTGSANSFVGDLAGYLDGAFTQVGNLQNATALGAESVVQASNAMVLGSVNAGTKVGIGTTKPTELLSVSPVIYSTGTASQTGTTVTGVGTTWGNGTTGPVYVGDTIIFADGTSATVTGAITNTTLVVGTSQNVSSQAYRIHRGGFNVTTTGNTYIRQTSTSAFQVQNAGGTSMFNINTTTGAITTGTWNGTALTDAYVSDTLTASILIGSGSTTNAVDLATAEVAGTLAYANGGTGSIAYTTNGVVYAGATGLQSTAAGATGQCLVGNTAAAPSWGSCGLSAEADTLATVTGRDATTTTAVTLQGGATVRGLTVDNATATTDTLALAVSSAATGTSFLGTITNANLTAARTWTLPNLAGTVALTSNNQTFTNTQTFSGTLSGTGTTSITGAATTIGDAAADTLTIGATIQGTNALLFEGSSVDANDLTIAITNPTAARTITLPDVTGTVITTGNLSGITGLTDSQISDTLTASILIGSGSTTNAVDLGSAEVAGTLAYGNGGTGSTTYTTNGVVYAGASGLQSTAVGATGQCLIGNTAAAPSWGSCNVLGVTAITGSNANGMVISGNSINLSIADATNGGAVTASNQNFGGIKTFNSGITVGNSAGTGSYVNNGSTLNTTLALGNLAAGAIGTAAATVDIYTSASIAPGASGRSYSVPDPTSTTAGRIFYISNASTTNSLTVTANAGALSSLVLPNASITLIWNGADWAFAGSDGGSILNQTANTQTAGFNINGAGTLGGLLTASSGLTVSGALNINTGTNANANINTGSTGTINIGGSTAGAMQLQSASSITLKGSSTADGDMLVKTTITGSGPQSLFSDGFESGNLNNWTSGGGVTVTSTGPRTGTYRADVASGGTGKFEYKSITSSYVSYVAYVKMPTTPTSLQYFMEIDTTNYGNALAYDPNGGSPRFYLYSDSGGGSGGGSTTFSAAGATWNANAWNKVEMQMTGNTTTNSIKAFLNDVQAGTWSINLTGQSITGVVVGTGNNINFNMQYDDIQVNGPNVTTYSGGNLTVERTLTINSDGTYSQRLCHNQTDGATTNMKLGDCSSGGADLAEYYNSDGSAEPGDIVVPVASGPTIGRSSAIYQANMMGVVSTNPTVDGIMGSTSTNKASRLPVALAGRVPLKVSLENGPIRAGDPLTASSIAGVAMKATKPGQIIGTALEDYDETSSSVSKAVQYEEAERNRLHMLELPQYQSDPSKWAPGVGKIMVLSKATYYDPSGVLQEIGSTVSLLQAQVSALQRGASLLDGTNFNGDLTVKGSLSVTGDLAVMGAVRFAGTTETADITIRGHITSGGTAPAVSAGRALGAATLASKPHVTVQGTDTAGTVTMNSAATDTTSGALATVAFTKPYNGPYHVVVSAQNDSTAALQLYVVKTATGFDILSRTPLTPNLQYQADYMVLGTAQ